MSLSVPWDLVTLIYRYSTVQDSMISGCRYSSILHLSQTDLQILNPSLCLSLAVFRVLAFEVNWLCSTSCRVCVRVRIGTEQETEYWGQLRRFCLDLLIWHWHTLIPNLLRSATRSVGPARSGLVPTYRVMRRTTY